MVLGSSLIVGCLDEKTRVIKLLGPRTLNVRLKSLRVTVGVQVWVEKGFGIDSVGLSSGGPLAAMPLRSPG